MVCLRPETRGGRMVGADESTELWRHPGWFLVCVTLMQFMRYNDYKWILGQWLWQSWLLTPKDPGLNQVISNLPSTVKRSERETWSRQWLREETHVLKAMGLNPSTVYWMENFGNSKECRSGWCFGACEFWIPFTPPDENFKIFWTKIIFQKNNPGKTFAKTPSSNVSLTAYLPTYNIWKELVSQLHSFLQIRCTFLEH